MVSHGKFIINVESVLNAFERANKFGEMNTYLDVKIDYPTNAFYVCTTERFCIHTWLKENQMTKGVFFTMIK